MADRRAATPSAAAELISPDQEQLASIVGAQGMRLQQVILRRIAQHGERLRWLSRRLRHPGARLRDQAQRLDELDARLRTVLRQRLREAESRLANAHTRLGARNPLATLTDRERFLGQLQRRLQSAIRASLSARQSRLAACARLLDSVSPLATLDRGYAIVSSPEGEVIQDAATVVRGTRIRARLARGTLECEVLEAFPPPA